jgi:AcrR family transcriptional regulator
MSMPSAAAESTPAGTEKQAAYTADSRLPINMGRYQPVDRDKVLDAAEAILRTRGIAALTIDAVAKAAGISKGGVQSGPTSTGHDRSGWRA